MKRLRAIQVQGDSSWIDGVLPSATEMSEEYGGGESEGDAGFWESNIAKQVMATMAAFKDAERAKQEEVRVLACVSA